MSQTAISNNLTVFNINHEFWVSYFELPSEINKTSELKYTNKESKNLEYEKVYNEEKSYEILFIKRKLFQLSEILKKIILDEKNDDKNDLIVHDIIGTIYQDFDKINCHKILKIITLLNLYFFDIPKIKNEVIEFEYLVNKYYPVNNLDPRIMSMKYKINRKLTSLDEMHSKIKEITTNFDLEMEKMKEDDLIDIKKHKKYARKIYRDQIRNEFTLDTYKINLSNSLNSIREINHESMDNEEYTEEQILLFNENLVQSYKNVLKTIELNLEINESPFDCLNITKKMVNSINYRLFKHKINSFTYSGLAFKIKYIENTINCIFIGTFINGELNMIDKYNANYNNLDFAGEFTLKTSEIYSLIYNSNINVVKRNFVKYLTCISLYLYLLRSDNFLNLDLTEIKVYNILDIFEFETNEKIKTKIQERINKEVNKNIDFLKIFDCFEL